MRIGREGKIQDLIARMKSRTTRYKRASEDAILLKNDLDIIGEELEELQRVLASSEDSIYHV